MMNLNNLIAPLFIEFHISQADTDRITKCLVKKINEFVVLNNGCKITEEYYRSYVSNYISEKIESGLSLESVIELLCIDKDEQKALFDDMC